MVKGDCVYNDMWAEKDDFKGWLARGENEHSARCTLCKKSFSISGMGISAVKSHAHGAKHKLLVEHEKKRTTSSATQLTMHGFTLGNTSRESRSQPPSARQETGSQLSSSSAAVTEGSQDAPSTSAAAGSSSHSSKQKTIDESCTKNDVLSAEVYWTLFAMEKHYSYHSFTGVGEIFKKMFPSSSVAEKFACSETKARYLTTFGLAPHFLDLLNRKVKSSDGYVLLFDESFNQELKRKQLDVLVRFWDEKEVTTRYLTSRFLGHATADHLYSELADCCDYVGKAGILQLSMDGPNVNWATYDRLAEDIERDTHKEMFNVGSCGVHVVHNAFKCGVAAAEWDIEYSINAPFWLFKDSPARREDFSTITGCTDFPQQFCSVRWLENVSVCERLLKIWPHIVTYVNTLTERKKCPTLKSFAVVQSSVNDPLFSAKLQIFVSVAKEIEPFLAKYQSDKPLLPFLAEDLFNMILKLTQKFVKEEYTKDIDTIPKLFELTKKLTDMSLHKDTSKVECGFLANRTLQQLSTSREGKVEAKDVAAVRRSTKKMYMAIIDKILEKSPLRYTITRSLAWLNPGLICQNKAVAVNNLKRCLGVMVDCKQVDSSDCDSIISQYKDFCREAAQLPDFQDFDRDEGRLDTLFHSALSSRKDWELLWQAVRKMLILSHGQASVERGFSVNKQISTDNMSQKAVTAQRIITDHLAKVGGADKVEMTKALLYNVASARQRYQLFLEEEKKKSQAEVAGKKRKGLLDEIEDLKTKKRKLASCAEDLIKTADELALKAEASLQVKQQGNLIAKSNAMRRSAKEKTEEVSKLEQKLCAKLEELKEM